MWIKTWQTGGHSRALESRRRGAEGRKVRREDECWARSEAFASEWDAKEGKACDFLHDGARWRGALIHQRMGHILSLQWLFGVAEDVPPPHLPYELHKSHAHSCSAPQKIPASPEGGTPWNRHTRLHVKLNAPVKKKCGGREAGTRCAVCGVCVLVHALFCGGATWHVCIFLKRFQVMKVKYQWESKNNEE